MASAFCLTGQDFINLSGVTDPYQPIERQLKITRSLLEVFVESNQAVSLITKNALITRDIDLLRPLAEIGAINVVLSITTLDAELARALEPRCSIPAARFRAVEQLAQANIPVHVNVAPLIPGLNDHEIPGLLSAASNAGATSSSWTLLRLPGAVEPIFIDWLERHRPLSKTKILDRLRGLRDGKLHDPRFETRMRGEGFFSTEFKQLFDLMLVKHGLGKRLPPLNTQHFKPLRDPNGQRFSLLIPRGIPVLTSVSTASSEDTTNKYRSRMGPSPRPWNSYQNCDSLWTMVQATDCWRLLPAHFGMNLQSAKS